MKLFAIITAGLMAAGGGYYAFSGSTCSKGCGGPTPVAVADAPASDCCSPKLDCCATPEPCCALSASASAKPSACCAAKEECCLIQAACCAAEAVAKTGKPTKISGCCDEGAAGTTQTVTAASAAIAGAK